jgi:hypothetical protein
MLVDPAPIAWRLHHRRFATDEGGTAMPLIALALAAFALAFEQFIQWQFGAVGVVALAMLTMGTKFKHTTTTCIGAVILAILVAQPLLG